MSKIGQEKCNKKRSVYAHLSLRDEHVRAKHFFFFFFLFSFNYSELKESLLSKLFTSINEKIFEQDKKKKMETAHLMNIIS